jgi:mevalonate kinase
MIQASAPAKIILFGEHAVVYGKPAIAVPVSSLRATAIVNANDPPGQGLHIVAQCG